VNLFNSLIEKYKNSKQKSLNKKEFRNLLLEAVSDGKITEEETKGLERKKTELGLTSKEIKDLRIEIYTTAFSAAKSDTQITKDEEKELLKIQNYLGIEDAEIEHNKKELARLRLLNEIQLGNIPEIPLTNFIKQKGEIARWVELASLLEEKVIRRRYEGGSRGMSFRIMKGVSYRVGGHRGHITSETGIVEVGRGDIVLTNKRIVFRGDRKSFATKLNNILDVRVYTNGAYLSENNKSKPRLIKFQDEKNRDIVGAILTHSINHYEE